MPIKAVLFDFMGTCLDWHSSVVSALPSGLSAQQKSDFALDWRQTYFDINAKRVSDGLPPEDFDLTLLKALDHLVSTNSKYTYLESHLEAENLKPNLVRAFHNQKAWPDVQPALEQLREKGYEIFVHANGTTRLQLDLCKSSGLKFDMLFSSELLGYIKPDVRAYHKGLDLIRWKAEECVLVAAHAYDLRGAKEVGMKTLYVYRWTDDVLEDQERLKGEFGKYLREGMEGLVDGIEALK